jgi:hypothetical protein
LGGFFVVVNRDVQDVDFAVDLVVNLFRVRRIFPFLFVFVADELVVIDRPLLLL